MLKKLFSQKKSTKGTPYPDYGLYRYHVIQHYLSTYGADTHYLEIGTNLRNTFDRINSPHKDGVDPKGNITYPITSDEFFKNHCNLTYDVIYIDGLHLHEQVYKDILNSLEVLKPNGTIIMHDCNPPTIWHQREDETNRSTPAGGYWNGTTWKAFVQLRCERNDLDMFVIDTDWGLGVIKKGQQTPYRANENSLDYNIFDKNRTAILNLISVNEWKAINDYKETLINDTLITKTNPPI